MRAVQLNLHPAPADAAPRELFARWPSLADIPEAVASGSTRVTMVQAAACDDRFRQRGVDYRFVDLRGMDSGSARARHLVPLLRELRADVLHVHSLARGEDAAAIARLLPAMPIVVQDHADRVPHWWQRPAWRRHYLAVDAVAFTAAALANRFTRTRAFPSGMPVVAVPESSSRFTPGDRDEARAACGLDGDPGVLWVGHLCSGKDPLTVLEGFARFVERAPEARLHCAFGSAPLLDAVRARIAGDPRLRGRVTLHGRVDHARVQVLMRAADLFVAGSRAESCGFALLEAMASDLVPVVTDIPSFRELTGAGRVGALWPVGDAGALAEALRRVVSAPPPRGRIRAHFQVELSFAALGRRWASIYAGVAAGRRRRA
ncbi:glycosyltransferase family 4 protein [Luteibacter sahnii]|uniref:glycosyltransferase family 4 protein n=1 Tax=Luteibacter sahnii TaxID=3021977 RepID=UPI002A69F8F2|nr:glycosyltransferase family 4 protein [Luteibacter sp. PPL193]MDY1548467.1 glycosyltransferase family 4 protein [Luteibacter sp. PPL193]